MAPSGSPAAGFKFNTFQEIKSHSSILYNERMAILFYLLDMRSMNMHETQNVGDIFKVLSTLKQIYKNVRMLLRNNPTVRATLNLETKDPGIYITDVAFGVIKRMLEYCEQNGFTIKRVHIIIDKLDDVEMMIKDTLQYFHYFIRPDFRQKPDIEMATEKYKEMVDKQTLEELQEVVGKRHKVDFGGLGTSRIEMTTEIPYDEVVDGLDDEEENNEG